MSDPLTPEQLEFCDRWYPYAMGVAWRLKQTYYHHVPFDDLRAWAAVGLLKAARSYNPDLAKPQTHVGICSASMIHEYYRYEYQTRRKITEVLADNIVGTDSLDPYEAHTPNLVDRAVPDFYMERFTDVLAAAQIVQAVEDKLDHSSQAWQVFQLMKSGFKQFEIGKMLKLHESRICQIKTRILRPLFLEAMGN